MAALDDLGIRVAIRALPSEVAIATPFPEDEEHRAYDPAAAAQRFWRALLQGANWRASLSILFVATLLGCAAFAVGDEFHQSFVPSRTPSVMDVLIDICGALVGVAICVAVTSRKGLKQKRV